MKIAGKDLTEDEIIQYVKNYKLSIGKNSRDRYFHLIDFIPTEKKILDYGCGWGTFSKMMQEKGNEVFGIDRSENEIEICQTVWKNEKKFTLCS